MSISQKIFALASAFAFVLICVGGYGVSHMARLREDVKQVADQSTILAQSSHTLHRVASSQLRQMIQFERALRAATGRGHGEMHERSHQAARQEFARLQQELANGIAQGEAELAAALLRPLAAVERGRLRELRGRLVQMAAEQEALAEGIEGVFALIDDGAISQAVADAARLSAGAVSFDFELAGLFSEVRARTGETIGESQRQFAAGRAGLLLLVGFGGALSLISWALMGRSILTPLLEVQRIADAVSVGKRGVAFPQVREDETGRVLQSVHLMMLSVEAAEQQAACLQRDLDGALERVGEQNRRLHALERELAEARKLAAPSTPEAGGREIIGPQTRSDS